MRIFIFLYILKLIAQTESATHPNTVNVQLETILEFNDEDKDADVKFIENIQKILKKIKIALSPESGRRSLSNNLNNNKNKNIQFTNFILSAISIILSYDDEDLENAFMILDDEIRKYHYKGCKFYELVEDENVREFVAKSLDDLKKSKAEALRNKLYKVVNIIGNAKLVSRHRQFLDYINSLYRHESSKTFKNILEKLQNYRYKSKRSNMNLIDITRHGIRSVLFDHFSKLNPNVRKDIKKNIENTWSHNKNSKSKQTNEYKENDFVDTLTEETQAYKNSNKDKHEAQSSELNYNDIKYNILHAMVSNAVKKKHVIKGLRSFFTQRPVNITIKQIIQDNIRNELKFNPLWKENSVNETNIQKDNFLVPLKSAKRKPHSFKRKERKARKKRNKRNKIKTKIGNTIDTEDSVRLEDKRKTNKHQNIKANVENTEKVEDIVIVKDKTRNNLRSESLMKRPLTASQENIFISFNKLDENRTPDKDLETKSPPRKRKHAIKRKQFKKPRAKLNLHALSNEGISKEYGNYRRKIRNDKTSEDTEKDNEIHKVSAEIVRKSFIKRINNLEKQMEEIVRKVDDTPTNDDVYKVNKKTTEKKAESSTEISNKDKLNITVETITTKGTTLSYYIGIGPESIPDKDNIDHKIQSIEVTTSYAITDNINTNISYRQNSIDSEEAFHTDFDYSEAGILKKLNLNITLPEEQSKSNERVIKDKPTIPDGDKNKGKEPGLHRININLPEQKSEGNKSVIEENLKKPNRDQNKGKETGLQRINIALPEYKSKSNERDEIIIDEPKQPDKDKNNGTETGLYRINIALPEEKSEGNETIVEEKPDNETGLHRIEIPITNDNIILNNELDAGETL